MNKRIILLIHVMLISSLLIAQYDEFTLQERVTQSDIILEGEVISQFTFKKEGLIYTANLLDVCSIIYEEPQPSAQVISSDVYVITNGGNFNDEFNTWSHMLKLDVGMEGLFFLQSNINLIPDNPPSNSSFFIAYGQEQGFVSFAKDDNWDFQGKSLFEDLTDIDAYIQSINQITTQSSVTTSCIVNNKSGLVIRLDTVFYDGNEVVALTSIKGQLSRNYDLNEANIDVEFGDSIDLSQYNFTISTNNPTIQNNYILSWLQNNTNIVSIEATKNSTNTYQSVSTQFIDFLEIRFLSTLLSVTGLDQIQISDASYRDANTLFSFLDFDIVNNQFLNQFVAVPNMTSFVPLDVCAGIKADQSVGNPLFSGMVIITGNNFDDIDPADFEDEIPHNYRVEFRREEDLNSNSFKVTPLPEDYISWTDNEIQVRVPTAGWLVNNNNIIQDDPVTSVAVTGRIVVRNPDGSDNDPENHLEEDKEVRVHFAQRNYKQMGASIVSSDITLINQNQNGGYLFVFDDSFDGMQFEAGNLAQAKQDIRDAFCEWNITTGIQLEIVDVCPAGIVCSRITRADINAGGAGMIALAAGLSSSAPFPCPGEEVVTLMELRFNSAIDDWVVSATPNPSGNARIVKAAALHEIGHLLQLGHVYNEDATMHPLYGNQIQIDNDAAAGGTHVGNYSFNAACNTPLVQGQIAGCMNPVYEIFDGQKVQISPNPASTELELSFDNLINEKVTVDIYDILGRRVVSQKVNQTISTIDISTFKSGNYFIQISYDNRHSGLLKFIKI